MIKVRPVMAMILALLALSMAVTMPTYAQVGSGNAFYTESRMSTSLPTSFTSILHLDLPGGSYIVNATVLVNNLGPSHVPVLCVLSSPLDSSVISAVQLEPETQQGASGATLPLGLATTLTVPGRVDLSCQSNTGPDGATAEADQMQITAVTVGTITVQ